MVDRISPLKLESADTGGTQEDQFATSLNRNEDFLDARGLTIQDNSSNDEVVKITRDNATGDMTLEDALAGLKTLSQLSSNSKSITVEDPTSTEDISMFFTNKAITITEIRAVVRGTTPSVTWTVRHGIDRSATGAEAVTSGTTTTSESTGSDVTSFNDATIVADSFVWLETTAESGTTDELAITIFYTED